MNEVSFLAPVRLTPPVQALYDEDLAEDEYVANASRLWAYQPTTYEALYALMGRTVAEHSLTIRDRAILIVACASSLGDAYCSIAWGTKLAAMSDEATAVSVLVGDDSRLTDAERAMASWARKVAKDPGATTITDVDELRDAGFSDDRIFAITVYLGLRIALTTVNDALGARPDAQYRDSAPSGVLAAVTYGRPLAEAVPG